MTTVAAPSVTAAPTTAQSVPAVLMVHAKAKPAAVALRKKKLGCWKEYSWAQYVRRVEAVGLGLLTVEVEAGDRVAIQSGNRPAWVFVDMAVQGLGAIPVGVSPSSQADELAYVLADCGASVLIAEDEEQLDKALAVRSRLPELRHIVVIDPRNVRQLNDPMIHTFADVEARGELKRVTADDEWRRRASSLTPTDVAAIAYTSGTSGRPKGAVLTHANLLAAASAGAEAMGLRPRDEILSYLPLSHITERVTSLVAALLTGCVVNFSEGGASFAQDLREVQPTVFLGVPRVWERMLASVQVPMVNATWLKRRTFQFWLARGRAVAPARRRGRLGPLSAVQAGLGWLLIYRSVRNKLGLGRVRVAISQAAPIAPQVLEYLWALGVPVRENYGQTESSGVTACTPGQNIRIGSVGVAAPGVDISLARDNEILVRGPVVFAGYHDNRAATAAALDRNGWLHTGDLGAIDSDGFLSITGRKKGLVDPTAAKGVSLSRIEDRLRVSPFVRDAVVVGVGRPHLVALISIEMETVGGWASRQNLSFETYKDLTERPKVLALIQSGVDDVNAAAAPGERIERFVLLSSEPEAEPPSGEPAATQDARRAELTTAFAEVIEDMYR